MSIYVADIRALRPSMIRYGAGAGVLAAGAGIAGFSAQRERGSIGAASFGTMVTALALGGAGYLRHKQTGRSPVATALLGVAALASGAMTGVLAGRLRAPAPPPPPPAAPLTKKQVALESVPIERDAAAGRAVLEDTQSSGKDRYVVRVGLLAEGSGAYASKKAAVEAAQAAARRQESTGVVGVMELGAHWFVADLTVHRLEDGSASDEAVASSSEAAKALSTVNWADSQPSDGAPSMIVLRAGTLLAEENTPNGVSRFVVQEPPAEPLIEGQVALEDVPIESGALKGEYLVDADAQIGSRSFSLTTGEFSAGSGAYGSVDEAVQAAKLAAARPGHAGAVAVMPSGSKWYVADVDIHDAWDGTTLPAADADRIVSVIPWDTLKPRPGTAASIVLRDGSVIPWAGK